MPALKIEQFGGMLPAWDAHLLPEGQSPSSTNGYLFSGALEGWRKPDFLRNLNNSAAQFVYRIPTTNALPATAYLVFTANAVHDDTITVSEDTYTFKSAQVNDAYDVLIGANASATATNLLNALTGDNGTYTNQGSTYGKNTVANSAVATQNELAGGQNNTVSTADINSIAYVYMQVYSPDVGAAYNNTPVSSTSAHAIWLKDLLSLADTTAFFVGGVNSTFSNEITAPSTWLEFLDPYTNVVKSQVVNDKFQRYYFASPSQMPQYNTLARIQAGNTGANAPFLLGINPPGCAPIVQVQNGGNSATLGCTTSLSQNSETVGANTVYLLPIVPNSDLSANSIQFMPNSTDNTMTWCGVIYLDANDGGNIPTEPGALVGVGVVQQGITSGILADSAFTNPPDLSANVAYWIGIMMDTEEQVLSGDNRKASVVFSNTFTNGPPAQAPSVTRAQPDLQMYVNLTTSDVIEARSYVYTWVSAYGEESAPSPYTLVNGWSNGQWTIGLFTPPADDLGITRNLAILRLYRTVTASGGSTVYYWVADVSLGSTNADAMAAVAADVVNGVPCSPPSSTYVDTIPDSTVALNIQMPSTNYFPPPENLEGIMVMPNGMYASFTDNEIWFAEPYLPHAWPPGNTITTDFPIVGIGLTGTTLVACTQANSWAATGTNPSQMSLVKCSPPDPCTSRGSILSNDTGVYYISPNGMIQVTAPGVSANVTELWITREKWAALVPLKNTAAIPLASCYFCYGFNYNGDNSVAQQGFNIELDQDNTSFTIWPQPGGHRVGFNGLIAPANDVDADIQNLMIDPWTSYGMIIQDGAVYWWNFANPSPTIMPYDWQSKWYQQNAKKSYEAMRCFFTVPPGTPAPVGPRNQAPANDPSWNELGDTQYAIIKVWADLADPSNPGQLTLVTAREVRRSGELLRIESGFKTETWQWEILGRVVISNLQVATSVKELANV